MTVPLDARWYVVQTHSNSEAKDRRVGFLVGERARVPAGAPVDGLATVEINDRRWIALWLDFFSRKARVFVGADLNAAA